MKSAAQSWKWILIALIALIIAFGGGYALGKGDLGVWFAELHTLSAASTNLSSRQPATTAETPTQRHSPTSTAVVSPTLTPAPTPTNPYAGINPLVLQWEKEHPEVNWKSYIPKEDYLAKDVVDYTHTHPEDQPLSVEEIADLYVDTIERKGDLITPALKLPSYGIRVYKDYPAPITKKDLILHQKGISQQELERFSDALFLDAMRVADYAFWAETKDTSKAQTLIMVAGHYTNRAINGAGDTIIKLPVEWQAEGLLPSTFGLLTFDNGGNKWFNIGDTLFFDMDLPHDNLAFKDKTAKDMIAIYPDSFYYRNVFLGNELGAGDMLFIAHRIDKIEDALRAGDPVNVPTSWKDWVLVSSETMGWIEEGNIPMSLHYTSYKYPNSPGPLLRPETKHFSYKGYLLDPYTIFIYPLIDDVPGFMQGEEVYLADLVQNDAITKEGNTYYISKNAWQQWADFLEKNKTPPYYSYQQIKEAGKAAQKYMEANVLWRKGLPSEPDLKERGYDTPAFSNLGATQMLLWRLGYPNTLVVNDVGYFKTDDDFEMVFGKSIPVVADEIEVNKKPNIGIAEVAIYKPESKEIVPLFIARKNNGQAYPYIIYEPATDGQLPYLEAIERSSP